MNLHLSAGALSGALLLAACGGDGAQPDDERFEVTVTQTVTASPENDPDTPTTPEDTSTPEDTTSASPEPTTDASAPEDPSGSAADEPEDESEEHFEDFDEDAEWPVEDFDEEWALVCTDRILEDLEIVDERLSDGIQVSNALYLLSDSYDCLNDAGVPGGADPADYLARVGTLSQFAELAADEFDYDPMNATARYTVLKEETTPLFEVLSAATGVDLRVP
ncbi:hypothetical protein [Ornithinimicrobium sediminis]|uniref:hypothetical protein n=1 Tax=Ornithinimicrobium sediminis TaxID=2904603 RepID=UPI001E4A9F3F|nr:hypothetical protein [Ornithinimicrobium sediminis]MCE0488263.1 hypothetical protein [Ornithinimicrobium sediminis]